MEIVYFTAVAIILYFLADSILLQMERKRGKPFEQRSLIFFVIITVLAVTSFSLIQHFAQQ